MGMLGLLPVLLSFGAIDSLIPLLIIIILIGSAAAMTRGWDVFKLLGIDFVAGIGQSAVSGKRGLGTAVRSSTKYMAQKPAPSPFQKTYGVVSKAISKKVISPVAGAGAAAGKTLLSGTNTGKKFVDWIGKDKEKTALTSSLYSYANPSTPSGRVKMAVGSAGAKRIAGTLVGGGVGARIKLKGYQQMTEDASLSPEKREMARKRVEKLRSGLKISQPTSAGELMAAEATYNSKIEKIIADRTSELKKSTGGVQMSRDYELEMADEITKAIEPLARQKALLEETKQLAQSGPVSRASIEQLVENYKTKPLATGAGSPAAEGVRAASEISAAVAAARTAPQTNMQKVSEILELNEQSALTIAGMAGAIVITGGVATVSALTYWKNRKRERERIANYTKNKTPLQTKP